MLPLAKNARYTENGDKSSNSATHVWGPTVTLGNYKLYFADPQAGQVGFFGTIEEHGHPIILGLRLKVCFPSRKTWQTSPSSIKRSRLPSAELIRFANSYFEGMEAGTDKNTPFDKDCQRIGNGVITSNDPASESPITRMNCGAQFATGFTKVITRVEERRFPVVDEERRIVLAIVRYHHMERRHGA